MTDLPPTETVAESASGRLRARDLGVAWLLYLVLALVISYPLVKTLGSTLPGSLTDPLQHLWVMRWYRTCLTEWRSPLICPDLQYPTGAPLGNFSPLHLQSVVFIPLSLVLGNDVLCFNLVWLLAMTTTGLGTFVLAWSVLRDTPCAAFAGTLAMLSTPMLMHAREHLELISLGGFPLFLVGWMRFVDRPNFVTLTAAAGLYLIVSMCAAYYAVFAILPAALYVAWSCLASRRDWSRRSLVLLPWLMAFAALVLPAMIGLFSAQIWAGMRGYASERQRSEFLAYGSAPWSFVIPTPFHRLSRWLPGNVYAWAGYSRAMDERASYLGIVSVFLILIAAVRGTKFRRRRFFWIMLTALVLMAWGGEATLGGRAFTLPSGWLRSHVSSLRVIRVPARYNLLAGVVAAVIAGAGLKEILSFVTGRSSSVAIYLALAFGAMADLLLTRPFPTPTIPEMPPCYRAILARDPEATFLDVPQFPSTGSPLSSMAGYWQSIHKGRTASGYSGNGNSMFDDRMMGNSPFRHSLLDDPSYLADPDVLPDELSSGATFAEYAWLYLRANRLRYLVLHDWEGYAEDYPQRLRRLKPLLEASKVHDDGRTIVFDRERMSVPSRPVVLSTEGWRIASGSRVRSAGRSARLVVFNPDPERPVRFSLRAASTRSTLLVSLRTGDRELSRWAVVRGDEGSTYRSPDLTLPPGIQQLTLESEIVDGHAARDVEAVRLDVSDVHIATSSDGPTRPIMNESPKPQ